MKTKHFTLLGLTLAGIGSMIGSGWLFGAWKAAEIAGPAAVLAWPIGACAMGLLAMAYAELGAVYPRSGGMVRFAQLTHGSFTGFMGAWANWISIVSVIPIEAVSSIQYLSSWPYPWAQALYVQQYEQLSTYGLLASAGLVLMFFLLNYWSIKLFLRSMMAITVFKVIVPLITCVMLFYSAISSHQFSLAHENFLPYGISGIFTAVATSGIIFSFNGFQSPVNLSGTSINPRRDVPLAIFFSITLVFLLYLALQFAFIGAIPASDIVDGWHTLNLSSPYVHLAMAFNLHWLVILLYVDAFISPSGTGVIYTATTSRMLIGMQKNGYMPYFIANLHPTYLISRPAMWVNLILSFAFLYVFRGWGALVAVISVATIISYLTGPVSAMAVRRHGQKIKNPMRIKALPVIAPITFVFISFLLYWARWPLTGEIIFVMLVGQPIYFYYQHKHGWYQFAKHFKAGVWLATYLIVMALLSFLGDHEFGGMGIISTPWDYTFIAVMGFLFYRWGLASSWKTEGIKKLEQRSLYS